jgi:hypothetical protein
LPVGLGFDGPDCACAIVEDEQVCAWKSWEGGGQFCRREAAPGSQEREEQTGQSQRVVMPATGWPAAADARIARPASMAR